MKNEPQLTVTREAGAKQCVLTRREHFGFEIEISTTPDPQMMVDYLDDAYPGQVVKWRLLPTNSGGTDAVPSGTTQWSSLQPQMATIGV